LRGIKNVKLREAAHVPLHYYMTFESANHSFVLFMKHGFVKYILFRGDFRSTAWHRSLKQLSPYWLDATIRGLHHWNFHLLQRWK